MDGEGAGCVAEEPGVGIGWEEVDGAKRKPGSELLAKSVGFGSGVGLGEGGKGLGTTIVGDGPPSDEKGFTVETRSGTFGPRNPGWWCEGGTKFPNRPPGFGVARCCSMEEPNAGGGGLEGEVPKVKLLEGVTGCDKPYDPSTFSGELFGSSAELEMFGVGATLSRVKLGEVDMGEAGMLGDAAVAGLGVGSGGDAATLGDSGALVIFVGIAFSCGLRSKWDLILSFMTNFRRESRTSDSVIEEGFARDEVQIEAAISEKKYDKIGGLSLSCSLGCGDISVHPSPSPFLPVLPPSLLIPHYSITLHSYTLPSPLHTPYSIS